MLFIARLSALAALALTFASAAPLPAGLAAERRFDLVKGVVRPGLGYVPTATIELASAPTEVRLNSLVSSSHPSADLVLSVQLPSTDAYFLLPDSLNLISPRAKAADAAEFAKRMTRFLLVRPGGIDDDGRLPEFVRLQSAEEDEAERHADMAV